MPEDLKIPFEYDESGDAASVTGEEFYYRHALQLAQLGTEDVRGGGLTAADIPQIRDRIGTVMEESPYFDPPIEVTVTNVDGTTIEADIRASNVSTFEIEI